MIVIPDFQSERHDRRLVDRIRGRAFRVVTGYLLAGLVGLLAGCSRSGDIAPVDSPNIIITPIPNEPATLIDDEREHLVKKGDTLYSIAWRHDVDYRTLARTNGIDEPFTIFPGQRIRILSTDDRAPPASDRIAVIDESDTSGAASTHALGPQPTLKLTPVPQSESAPPKPAPPKPASPESASSKPASPKPAAKPPRKVLPKTPAQPRQPVSKPSGSPRSGGGSGVQATVADATRLRWVWPTKGKTVGRFARGGGKGINIVGSFGQPIQAAARGRVVYAGSGLIGYGKLIIIKHNNRLLSAYAHSDKLHVKEGEVVKGGRHIADMGRSGTGPAVLHFEIRRGGKPVDPLRYLSR